MGSMTIKITSAKGPFPHALVWTVPYDADGLEFSLRCFNCHGFFGKVGYAWTVHSGGPSPHDIEATLREKRECHPLKNERCPGMAA